MYAEGEDPLNLAILKGEVLPQPDYLERMNLTLDQFKKNLQTKVDRKSYLSNPSTFEQTELEALQAEVLAGKLALATANKSHGRIQSNLKKTIEKQAEDIKRLQEEVVVLTGAIASLKLQDWNGETIFNLRDVEFKAIMGLEKADWMAYLAHLDLHGASKQWTFTVTDWKTGYTIAQIKLRQNLIYPLLKKMFNVSTSSCSNIFRYFVQFAAHVSAHTMNVDRVEYSELFRMTPLRYNHNKYAFTKITDMTDANEGPMQNLSNEEARHAAHSAYYDDARIKHQVVLCASCEPKWISTAYLARGASDSEILENGTSKGLGNVAAKKFYDTLSANAILVGDKGTLALGGINRHNAANGKQIQQLQPPNVHDGQLTTEERQSSGAISTVRISSENIFARLENYKITDRWTVTSLPLVDYCLLTIYGQIIFQGPVIKARGPLLTKEEISAMFPITGKIAQRVTGGVASEVGLAARLPEQHEIEDIASSIADINKEEEDEEELFLRNVHDLEIRHEHGLDGWEDELVDGDDVWEEAEG